MMMNLLLYVVTVFIWGTTWLAIKLQLGEVAPAISIFYRFALGALLMSFYCKCKGISLKFRPFDHLFLLLLGICMFSFHYIFIYKASIYLVSGLVSVIFSIVSLFNITNSILFLKRRPETQVIIGACMGFCGIIVFFWDELMQFSLQKETLYGVGLALVGSLLFSVGNLVSFRNKQNKIPLIAGTTVAMIYGAISMLIYCFGRDLPFLLPPSGIYWGALLYLTIPGSIVAFLSYFTLIARIGPERAGYATILFPIVALGVSVVFENYRINLHDLFGVTFILVGNVLLLIKKRDVISPSSVKHQL